MADYPLNPPEDDSEGFTLPPRAGASTLMGLRPADWIAMLGGLLSGVRVGSPQARAQGGGLRPGLALFPLAQGLEASDRRARSAEGVKALQSQYGGMEDLPEFKTALMLAQQDDWKGAMNLLGRGITDRNTRARETRTAERTGQAAEGYGTAMRPVTEPGRPALPEVPQVGQEDDFLPAVAGTSAVDRPPEIGEIINRLQTEIKDPVVRGLAFDKANQALSTRTAEEAKLRPRTEVHADRFIQFDPRRGTATAGEELPETTAQRATRLLREARTKKEDALTARAERDPNAPLGTAGNPHVSSDVALDENGVRRRYKVFTWVTPSEKTPGKFDRHVFRENIGESPFKPPAPSRAGDYTTTTTGEGTKPAKPIWNLDTLKSLQDDVPKALEEIYPGFKAPGMKETVTLPGGTTATGQQLIDIARRDLEALYKKRGLDVTIRWVPNPGYFSPNAGEFRIVGAAESEKKLPKKSTTIRQQGVFPPPVMPPSAAADDDDDRD